MTTPVPYPSDTRAKGWRFELDHERIRQSDTWALAPRDVRPWLLMLWMVAWEQTPCGSLPDDDELIAARIDMDPEVFARMKSKLLRGWWKADDGRLYHNFIATMVETMIAVREKDAARMNRHRNKTKDNADVTRDKPVANTEVTPDPVVSNDTSTGTSTSTKTELSGSDWRSTTNAPPAAPPASHNGRFEMHLGWRPGPEFAELLPLMGVPANCDWEMELPEFALFRRAEGEKHNQGIWEKKFIDCLKFNEARRLKAGNDPTPMDPNWRPELQTRDAFERSGIDRDFVEGCITEFVAFWLEAGGHQRSWNAKFIQHVNSRWAKRAPAQRSTFDQLNDTSWANGMTPPPDLKLISGAS